MSRHARNIPQPLSTSSVQKFPVQNHPLQKSTVVQRSHYVISTNETHSVQEFVEEAFAAAGMDWEKYVEVDELLKRPKDVVHLRGDNSKAKEILNWQPKVKFKKLVRIMVDADVKRW